MKKLRGVVKKLGGGQGSFALPQKGKVYKMLLISKVDLAKIDWSTNIIIEW